MQSIDVTYYVYRLKVMSGLNVDFTLMSTYQDYLQNKEDVVYFIKTCLNRKLVYLYREPQHRETTINNNIFVWKTNITDIDYWRDEIKWTI